MTASLKREHEELPRRYHREKRGDDCPGGCAIVILSGMKRPSHLSYEEWTAIGVQMGWLDAGGD
jgi:hypothetical protein